MLVFILAPILVMVLGKYFPKSSVRTIKNTLLFFLVFVFVIMCFVYISDNEMFNDYLHFFTKAFDDEEESTKFVQAQMFINHFLENPIFGEGTGTVFYEPDRMTKQHQYELTYMLILATRGIIGSVFYFIGYFGIFIVLFLYFLRTKDMLLLSFIFGYGFSLIANGTNPVLSSFDMLLPIYIGYALVNYECREKLLHKIQRRHV